MFSRRKTIPSLERRTYLYVAMEFNVYIGEEAIHINVYICHTQNASRSMLINLIYTGPVYRRENKHNN
jgi:hypothetical protein